MHCIYKHRQKKQKTSTRPKNKNGTNTFDQTINLEEEIFNSKSHIFSSKITH